MEEPFGESGLQAHPPLFLVLSIAFTEVAVLLLTAV
jgi:hypothetical protein